MPRERAGVRGLEALNNVLLDEHTNKNPGQGRGFHQIRCN
jgi:hypothetical protein